MITEVLKVYKERDDVTLTTYITAEKGELHVITKRPAVIICPGGAYITCSDREAEPVALRFSSMGYQTFVLRYSVYDENKGEHLDLFSELSAKTHCPYPAPILDIGNAMLLINENADLWQVDTEKIILCGFSAGAHNVAMYGNLWNSNQMKQLCSNQLLKPAGMILGYAVTDYFLQQCLNGTDFENKLRNISNVAYFGVENPTNELLEKVSPARNVNEFTPVAFLWGAAEDNLVPIEHTIQMANALAQKKIPFEMHVYENGCHGLSLGTQATATAMPLLNSEVAQWIDSVQKWMERHFPLEMPKNPTEIV